MIMRAAGAVIDLLLTAQNKARADEQPTTTSGRPLESGGDIIGNEAPWDDGDNGKPDTTKPIFRDPDDDPMHRIWLGHPGSGKTTGALGAMVEDIKAQRNIALFDPDGGLVKHVLEYLAATYKPEDLVGRLYLIDYADDSVVIPNNVLAGPGKPSAHSSLVYSVIRERIGMPGVQVDDNLRASLTGVAEAGGTLLDADLCSPNFEPMMATSTDFGVKAWLRKYRSVPQVRAQWQLAQSNKLSPYVMPRPLFLSYGQPEPFPYESICSDPRQGKIILISMDTPNLGEGGLLAGSIHLAKLFTTFLARTHLPEDPEHRIPLRVYCEEAHNLLDVASHRASKASAEGRRIGLCMGYLMQGWVQVSTEMSETLLSTTGTIYAFRLSARDAAILARSANADVPQTVVRQALTQLQTGEAVIFARGRRTVRARLTFTPFKTASADAVAAMRRVGQSLGRSPGEAETIITARQSQAGPTLPTYHTVANKGRFAATACGEETEDGD